MSERVIDGDLHRRLQLGLVALRGTPYNFGSVAVDVGGRDGRNIGLISELGPEEIFVVDPEDDQIRLGVEQGWIEPDNVFAGTLEKWVSREDHEPVDSAFAFNLQPKLVEDMGFMQALGSAVSPEGIAVITVMEPATAWQLGGSMMAAGGWEEIDLGKHTVRSGPHVGPDKYLSFWQRLL